MVDARYLVSTALYAAAFTVLPLAAAHVLSAITSSDPERFEEEEEEDQGRECDGDKEKETEEEKEVREWNGGRRREGAGDRKQPQPQYAASSIAANASSLDRMGDRLLPKGEAEAAAKRVMEGSGQPVEALSPLLFRRMREELLLACLRARAAREEVESEDKCKGESEGEGKGEIEVEGLGISKGKIDGISSSSSSSSSAAASCL
jgi:hypothetical protein